MRAGAPRNFFTVKYKSVFTALIVLTVVITAFAVLPLPKVQAGTPYPTFSYVGSTVQGNLPGYCNNQAGVWSTLCTACYNSGCNYNTISSQSPLSVNIPSAGTFVLLAVVQDCNFIQTAAPIVTDSANSKWVSLASFNVSASSSNVVIWEGINYYYAYVFVSGTDSITITENQAYNCIGGLPVWEAQGFSFGQLILNSPQGSTAAAANNAAIHPLDNTFTISNNNYYYVDLGFSNIFISPNSGVCNVSPGGNYYVYCFKMQNPTYSQQSASFDFSASGLLNSCSGSPCAVAYVTLAIAFTSNPAYFQGKQYIGNQAPITSGATLAQSSYVLSNAEQGTTATGSSLYIPFQPPSFWNQLTISNITVWLWGVKCAASGTPPTCTQSTFPVTIGLWYQQPNIAIPPTSSTPATALTADSCTYQLSNGTFAKPQAFTCSFPSPVSFYSTNGAYAIFLVISFTGSGTSPSYLYIDTSSAQNYQPYLDNCASDGYNSYYIRCGTLQSSFPAIYTSVAFQTAGVLTFTTSVFTSYTATVTSTTNSTSTISIISSTTQTVQTTYTQVINQVLNFPNINTFQFWWFPLTIWLIFIGLFAALGRAANADGKTMILLILLGLEFGSIAGALMGTTPFIFSVIFAAMLGVVLWKVH